MIKLATYLKWVATVVLIVGTGLNSFNIYPAGAIALSLGGFMWLIVSIIWKEPAMIVTNTVILVVGVAGLVIAL